MFVDSFIKRQTDMILHSFGGEAEQALMQEIFSAMEDTVISLDHDNRILTANAASEKMLGMLKKDILGRRLKEILKTIPVQTAGVLGGSAQKTRPFLLNGQTVTGTYVNYGVGGKERRILTIRETPSALIKGTHPAPDRRPTAKWTFDDIIGTSDVMQQIKRRAKIMAHNDATVLICGETGTGKELFAQAVHNESERRDRPFMAFNFVALSESLIESELFGYEEGAFTGAKKGGKKGLFEEAQGGTVFIDEIGDASLHIQTRLLRVLQEREILRVGATKTTKIDVKIIAATNQDLKELIRTGKFRVDLYYRLCVLTVNIPPLRKRRDCIPDLLAHAMRRYGFSPSMLSPEAYQGLLSYDWPGNVRELVNTVEYLAYTTEHAQTGFYDLPDEIQIALRHNRTQHADGASAMPHDGCAEDALGLFACTFGDQIAENILRTLLVCKNSGLRAGRRLLLNRLLRSGLSATEDRLRTMLHFLENNGLIVIGQTKQGTTITPLGEQLLRRN
jgi:transcriptional regulator with PAS, ATPase and Fis domain